MDYRLAMMCGIDLPIPECQLTVCQPKIKEIAFLGESEFFIGAQCLTLNKSMFVTEDKDVLTDITDFQIFMMVMNDKKAFDKKESTIKVLQLLFPTYKVMFSPRSLIFMKDGKNVTIDDSNFEYLQNIFKIIFCTKNGPMDQQSFNPCGDKAKEIAEKLMKGRARIAAEKGDVNASVFSQYLSILTIGLHIPMQNLKDLTMFQLYDLVERYNLYLTWDIDLRSRLAGGKPDKHPDNWMKNIH